MAQEKQASRSLPENWWRDKDTFNKIVGKRTFAEVENETGVGTTVLSKWNVRHGNQKRTSGVPTAIRMHAGEPVSEVEILRSRTKELEAILSKRRTGEVAEARLVETIERSVRAAHPRFKPKTSGKKSPPDAEEAALLFSDTHASEVVSFEQTLGMNSYDWDTMLGRMARLQNSMLSHLAHFSAPVEVLHLWCLGDMLSGDIHDELSETNDRPAAQAAVDFGYELARFVEELVPHFREIRVAGVPGNHPRAKKVPAAKNTHNNGDWIAYKVAEAVLAKYDSVRCHFPCASYATVSVAERWRTLLMHGDGIRSTMPGVPWGGVVRRITVLEQQFAAAKQPIDYVAMGHFHTANALDGVGVETFLNGSVKGLDEYSLKQFGSGRKPAQRLLTFHRNHGVTGMRWLNLTDNHPAAS